MNREMFLKIFQESLIGKVSNQIIQENLNYYNNYINEQIRNGKTEEEVIIMLGDPRLLAKTVEESNNFTAEQIKSNDFAEKKVRAGWKINKVKLRIGIIVATVITVLILFILLVFKVIYFFMPLIVAMIAGTLIYKLINKLSKIIR